MNPRKPLSSWQLFAQGLGLVKSGFAPTRFSLHDGGVGGSSPCVPAPHCYPFPMTWPSPEGVGPFFVFPRKLGRNARTVADLSGQVARGHGNFAFASGDDALESCPRTTIIRGRHSCGNSSLSFSSQSRLLAACKTPARVALLALSVALSLLMPPAAMFSMARLSAGLRALRLARSRARSAAEHHDLTAAVAGLTTKPATQGVTPLGWPFHFAPARAALT